MKNFKYLGINITAVNNNEPEVIEEVTRANDTFCGNKNLRMETESRRQASHGLHDQKRPSKAKSKDIKKRLDRRSQE